MYNFPSWDSYPSIFNLGHRAIRDLLIGPVLVQEKVDGSQFSFGVCPLTGELVFRSKGAQFMELSPEAMFAKGVEAIREIKHLLHPGWTYRGEYLRKPHHNALAYDRVPTRHVILFDINTGLQSFLPYEEVTQEALRLGLEVVPLLMTGIPSMEDIQAFLTKISVLGGQTIEGVVLKPVNYDKFGEDKKVLMGKYVSEAFKEVHKAEWKKSNPTSGDAVEIIAAKYKTPARWLKAVQHLREAGQIEDSPRDIGKLMKEVPEDILKECESEIKEALFNYAWPHIKRIVTHGLPEFYKAELLKKQFEGGNDNAE